MKKFILPGDIIRYLSSYLYWYEVLPFTIVNKPIYLNSLLYQESTQSFIRSLRRNIKMACFDHPSFTVNVAMEWGKHIVSYYYANPPSIDVGNICEGEDYLSAWSVCTILDTRLNYGNNEHHSLPYSFAPIQKERSLLDIMECGEMIKYEPCYREYYVRFHGWSSRWNEWLTVDKLSPLGTHTLNPWAHTCCLVRQWIIQRLKSGQYQLSINTLNEYPPHSYPPTDILIRCLVQRPTHHQFQCLNNII